MARDKAPETPHGTGNAENGGSGGVGDLEDRRKALDAALSARAAETGAGTRDRKTGGGAGFANALRLSSEFVAGVLVGAGIGYLFDRLAGTSPWGMIVFLLLGFVAGVLNVLRSAGLVAAPETRTRSGTSPDENED
ncbi:AtpZ/AtpI family protein [Oricola thermophila]|uniref:ATP synthase protein I n=1 Tax=Oricola thermophila TaxID=2742145 RepID=A0A6N1VE19_9HYPH|nr:AtpZ/AtpI family protein [Oricola thermophila]QKV18938.1 AtpZ/AtpI family protein [Oricola thermophila]